MSDLVFQTRPVPGAIGKLAALRTLIADRLGLPDTPGAISEAACAALLTYADGDERLLGMLLATLFFVAETDDLDRVDLPQVEQAIALQPASRALVTLDVRAAPHAAPAPRSPHVCTIFAGGAASFMLGAVAYLVAQTSLVQPPKTYTAPHSAASRPAAAPPAVTTAPPRASSAVPNEAAPRMSPAQAAQATPGARLAPLVTLPASTIRPILHLRFFMASAGAAPRARFIQQRLEAAGFLVVVTPNFWQRPPPIASLWYFYPGDQQIAQRAAHDALLLDRPAILASRQGLRRARPPPGTLELFVP
jgi:hypothetical protein